MVAQIRFCKIESSSISIEVGSNVTKEEIAEKNYRKHKGYQQIYYKLCHYV